LLDPNATETLIALAKQVDACMQERFGLPLGLIIIDTIVASAGYAKAGEENDTAINAIIMGKLATVSRHTGAFVLAVDHFGKIAETGTRGASVKEGSADVVLALLGERTMSGDVKNTRLAVRKNRAGPSGQEIPFTVREVEVALSDDETSTSLVVDWQVAAATGAKTKAKDERWSKSLRLLRKCLMNMLAADAAREMRPHPDGPSVRAIDVETVHAEFHKSYPADGDKDNKQAARRKAFYRAMMTAQDRNLIGVREIESTTYIWFVQVEHEK
jgi:AAA domain